jgi:phenylpyruvate tautomerase PptA (4-oxalocrotonate tautomerase family)
MPHVIVKLYPGRLERQKAGSTFSTLADHVVAVCHPTA